MQKPLDVEMEDRLHPMNKHGATAKSREEAKAYFQNWRADAQARVEANKARASSSKEIDPGRAQRAADEKRESLRRMKLCNSLTLAVNERHVSEALKRHVSIRQRW